MSNCKSMSEFVAPSCPHPFISNERPIESPSKEAPPKARNRLIFVKIFFELIDWFISSYPGRYVYRVTWRFWKTDYQGKSSLCRRTRLWNISQTAQFDYLFPANWQGTFICPERLLNCKFFLQIFPANTSCRCFCKYRAQFVYLKKWYVYIPLIWVTSTYLTLTTLVQSIRILWWMINKIFHLSPHWSWSKSLHIKLSLCSCLDLLPKSCIVYPSTQRYRGRERQWITRCN